MTKTLYLVRGLAGSGKSTLAKKLAPHSTFSADEYYEHLAKEQGKTYSEVFFPEALPVAHSECQQRAEHSMVNGVQEIAIANTFSQKWEAEPYFVLAEKYGYTVCIIECQSQFGSVHDVPEEVVEAMRDRWETSILTEKELSKGT